MSKDINPKNQTYQFGSNTAMVYETIEEMGQAAAQYFVVKIKEVLKQKDTANIVLATGNSMLTFLKALRREVDIDWSRINIFIWMNTLVWQTHIPRVLGVIYMKILLIMSSRLHFMKLLEMHGMLPKSA